MSKLCMIGILLVYIDITLPKDTKSILNNDEEKLHLQFQKIFRIEKNHFHKFYSLQKLNLANNEIIKIEDNAFNGTQIKQLHLEFNQLAISPKLSEISDTLQQVNLSHNLIEKVDCQNFHELLHVETLDLSHNAITTVSCRKKRDFQPLALQSLYLNDNKRLCHIDSFSFAGMNNIKHLVLINTAVKHSELLKIHDFLSLSNQVVVNKAKRSCSKLDQCEYEENYNINHITFDRNPNLSQQQFRRFKRSVNYDSFNTTQFLESLDEIYAQFQRSLSDLDIPTEAPKARVLGYMAVSVLILESCVLLFADMTELVRHKKFNKQLYKSASKTRVDATFKLRKFNKFQVKKHLKYVNNNVKKPESHILFEKSKATLTYFNDKGSCTEIPGQMCANDRNQNDMELVNLSFKETQALNAPLISTDNSYSHQKSFKKGQTSLLKNIKLRRKKMQLHNAETKTCSKVSQIQKNNLDIKAKAMKKTIELFKKSKIENRD